MPEVRIIEIDHGWSRFPEVQALYFTVLYEGFGVPSGADWYHDANGSVFAVGLGAMGRLLGAARLLPAPGDGARQIRQVAVSPEYHGSGLGRRLVSTLERRAAAEGATELWLNSRHTAYGFYERLGFLPEGPEFDSELTGIRHRLMRKQIVE